MVPRPEAGNWAAALNRLELLLAQRRHLRLRVACPSQEFSEEEMAFGVGRWLSCSRGIWESLTLRAERDLALVMLQAPPIGEDVLRYLFSLLPADAEDIARRHALVELEDEREVHLSEKILTRTSLIGRLRSTLRLARQHGHTVEGLSCYASSPQMAEVASQLGTDLIDANPELLTWGTKSGSREAFRQAGVPHPHGSYRAERSLEALAATLDALTARFGHRSWIVKTDRGFGSGHGNAIIDTTRAPAPIMAQTIVRSLRPCAKEVSVDQYLRQVTSVGAIVEQLVIARPTAAVRHPSALAYLRRDCTGRAEVEFLGVHDQIIGESGDFVGCRFPADPVYRTSVTDHARTAFDHLAALGVTGHVGVDFLAVVPASGRDDVTIYATEVNLRQTGSTHPHRTVRAVVQGTWTTDGTLVDQVGQEVFYKGTDGIIAERYVGLSSSALLNSLRAAPQVGFDSRAGHGVIPHLWSSLEGHGKVGATIIGASAQECDRLESDFVTLLEGLSGRRLASLKAGRSASPGA